MQAADSILVLLPYQRRSSQYANKTLLRQARQSKSVDGSGWLIINAQTIGTLNLNSQPNTRFKHLCPLHELVAAL
jgi:hypothetical protein